MIDNTNVVLKIADSWQSLVGGGRSLIKMLLNMNGCHIFSRLFQVCAPGSLLGNCKLTKFLIFFESMESAAKSAAFGKKHLEATQPTSLR